MSTVRRSLMDLWQHFGIDQLELRHPHPDNAEGALVVYLRKCSKQMSDSCELAAIQMRIHSDWHECCGPCYEIVKKRSSCSSQQATSNQVAHTDASSRARISYLSPDSKDQRSRNLAKVIRNERRKVSRLRFQERANLDIAPHDDSFRDAMATAFQCCQCNPQMF